MELRIWDHWLIAVHIHEGMRMSVEKIFVLMMDIVVGCLGFGLSILWGKFTGRDMDRDTVLFLGRLWGGIAIFGMVMLFIF
jgi:hypothetical protein